MRFDRFKGLLLIPTPTCLLHKILVLLGLLAGDWIIIGHAHSSNKELVIGYAEACPHMCPYNEDKGFTYDIAKAVLESKGWSPSFVALPWAPAVAKANAGQLNAVISTGKEESPLLIYPNLELATQKDCIYGHVDDAWKPSQPDSYLHRKTVVFKGWVFEQEYKLALGNEAYYKAFEEFSIDQYYTEKVINLIARKRMQGFWSDATVYQYYVSQHRPIQASFIKQLGCIHEQYLYIGFSPKYPELAKQLILDFDQGMKALRESGKLSSILQKYGLKDWR